MASDGIIKRGIGAVVLAVSLVVVTIAAAAASGKFDGTYDGTMIGQAASGASHAMRDGACADRLARSITIADGALSLVYNPESNIVLKGTVGDNGLFAAEAEKKNTASTGSEWTLRMSGSVVGDYLTAQVFAKTCSYRIQMRKKP
jgi:hypothetical protein